MNWPIKCYYRYGLDSNVLRFVAKMNSTVPADTDRLFIIFYYLSDDTIAVFEPPIRNSGNPCYYYCCIWV